MNITQPEQTALNTNSREWKKIPPQNPPLDPINKIEKKASVAGRGKSRKFLDENPRSCLVRIGEIPCAMSLHQYL